MTFNELIAALVQYGIDTGLTPACEKIYTTNLLLDVFREEDYEEPASIPKLSLKQILEGLLDEACPAHELSHAPPGPGTGYIPCKICCFSKRSDGLFLQTVSGQ